MAAEARREARRKRILQNSDSRLQKILDIKLSDSENRNEPIVTAEIKIQGEISIPKAEIPTIDVIESTSVRRDTTASKLPRQTVQPNTEQTIESQVQKEHIESRENVPCTPVKDKQQSNHRHWIRFGLNVGLALMLVLLSSYFKEYQNFLGPWIALQIAMFSFTSFRKDLTSNWLSVVQVALQLSGIPSHITSTMNTVYAFVFLLLADVPVFIFSTVFWVHICQKLTGVDVS